MQKLQCAHIENEHKLCVNSMWTIPNGASYRVGFFLWHRWLENLCSVRCGDLMRIKNTFETELNWIEKAFSLEKVGAMSHLSHFLNKHSVLFCLFSIMSPFTCLWQHLHFNVIRQHLVIRIFLPTVSICCDNVFEWRQRRLRKAEKHTAIVEKKNRKIVMVEKCQDHKLKLE